MKMRKRILALLLSSAMALTMGMTAFAASDAGVGQSTGTGTGSSENSGSAGSSALENSGSAGSSGSGSSQTTPQTCTITAPATAHQYEVYQIFTCQYETAADGSTKMTDIKWGSNGTGKQGEAVSDTILTELENASETDEAKLAVITKYVSLTTSPVETISNGGAYSGSAGYYLIKDKDTTIPSGETGTKFVVMAAGNVTINPKSSTTPGFEKKIKDINDSTETTYTGWQDSADYDIGDSIPFKLEGTVAEDYASYSTYYFAFHDKEENGLTFDGVDNVKVYVGDDLITTGYEVKTSGLDDGCTFEVVFNNLKDIKDSNETSIVNAGSKIRVEYTSTLNTGAVLGNQGNVNEAKLEYSNNPTGEQHGETTWDQVIAFTYKVVINKFNEDNKPLTGAKFKLEKQLKDGSWKGISVVETAEDTTTFTFKGLDDGHYKLTEIETPKYYNSISPIEFDVAAVHKAAWESKERTSVLDTLTGTKKTGEIEFTPDLSQGSLSSNVVNKPGTTLPETGGIGTTIFYIVGGVLVVGAAVALITKKRMKSSGKDR